MKKSAAIIGAGIAGLSAAALLLTRGWHVTVFERRHPVEVSGTSLVLRPGVVERLECEGIPVGEVGVRLSHIRIATAGGRTIIRQSFRDRVAPLAVGRPALVGLLENGASLAERLTATVTAGDLPSLVADFGAVVIADGVHSALRTAVFGSAHVASFAGATVWRGSAPGPTRGLSEFWGRGARFGMSARDGRMTNWYASVRHERPDHPVADDYSYLRDIFGRWNNPDVTGLVAGLDGQPILRHDVYGLLRPPPRLVMGRIAVIGDAAHAMTPDLGRGANEAIRDAFSLSAALARGGRPEVALRRYDRDRRNPTARLLTLSRAVSGVVHRHRVPVVR